jgi:ubiquinone/menaquinone biosynthesis C-methylase UbiE
MKTRDEIAQTNQRLWDRMVDEGCGFTIPWLDLNVDMIRQYAAGNLDLVPASLQEMYPARYVVDAEDKDVLCLASGGGQQSAVFGVLGAQVTVLDLTAGQLAGDRKAAEHYGYNVTTIQADMRDLSCLGDKAFDLVWQAPSLSYVSDLQPVFAEVYRVLRPGGVYRTEFNNPATQFLDTDDWDGGAYRMSVPYAIRRQEDEDRADFRHFLGNIFNGLVGAGLSVVEVQEAPSHFLPVGDAEPGSWKHWLSIVGGLFAVVCRKL